MIYNKKSACDHKSNRILNYLYMLFSFRYQLLVKDTSKRALLAALYVLTIMTLGSLVLYNIDTNAYVQKAGTSSDISGNIVNSKYLSITDHRYRQGEFGYDTITGTIVNNVAKNISFAAVYTALYDKNNTFITMESGSVSVSLLKPGDNSPFAIDIFGVKDIDHYTLFPAGTPG
jgi:hypothetical protein